MGPAGARLLLVWSPGLFERSHWKPLWNPPLLRDTFAFPERIPKYAFGHDFILRRTPQTQKHGQILRLRELNPMKDVPDQDSATNPETKVSNSLCLSAKKLGWPIVFWVCFSKMYFPPKGWQKHFQKWVCRVGKILVCLPPPFCPILDPPNAHMRQQLRND